MVKWLNKVLFVAISFSFFISATEMDLGECHNTFFDDNKSDTITSAAACIGISIALIGGKGYHNADYYAALVVSAINLINAYLIAKSAIDELMDASADEQVVRDIRTLACSVMK